MNDEIELVYNTRSRKKRFDTDFHARLATALIKDISVEIIDDEDDDALEDDDNDQGDDNLRNDNASDIEDELIIEMKKKVKKKVKKVLEIEVKMMIVFMEKTVQNGAKMKEVLSVACGIMIFCVFDVLGQKNRIQQQTFHTLSSLKQIVSLKMRIQNGMSNILNQNREFGKT